MPRKSLAKRPARFASPTVVLFLALFASQAGVLVMSPILARVAAEFDVSIAAAGQLRILAAPFAAGVALLTGRALARFSPRALIGAGSALLARRLPGERRRPDVRAARAGAGADVGRDRHASRCRRRRHRCVEHAGGTHQARQSRARRGAGRVDRGHARDRARQLDRLAARVPRAAAAGGGARRARRRPRPADTPIAGSKTSLTALLGSRWLAAGRSVSSPRTPPGPGRSCTAVSSSPRRTAHRPPRRESRSRSSPPPTSPGTSGPGGRAPHSPGSGCFEEASPPPSRSRSPGRYTRSMLVTLVLFALTAAVTAVRMVSGTVYGFAVAGDLRSAVGTVRGVTTQFGYLFGSLAGGMAIAVGGIGALAAVYSILFLARDTALPLRPRILSTRPCNRRGLTIRALASSCPSRAFDRFLLTSASRAVEPMREVVDLDGKLGQRRRPGSPRSGWPRRWRELPGSLRPGSSRGRWLGGRSARRVVSRSSSLAIRCPRFRLRVPRVERGKSLVDGLRPASADWTAATVAASSSASNREAPRRRRARRAESLVSTGTSMSDGPRLRRRLARARCRLPVLGERVCELEPGDLSLRDQNLAQQPAVLSLNGERRFAIVGCDEPEVDENLADRAAEVESERRDGWACSDDHVGVGRPTPVSAPARPRGAGERYPAGRWGTRQRGSGPAADPCSVKNSARARAVRERAGSPRRGGGPGASLDRPRRSYRLKWPRVVETIATDRPRRAYTAIMGHGDSRARHSLRSGARPHLRGR